MALLGTSMSGSTTITILGRLLAVMAARRAARALGICLGDAAWRRDSILLASQPGDPTWLVFRRVPRGSLSGTQVFAGAFLRLTELSNVVAYVSRVLQQKSRHDVHSLPFPSSRAEPSSTSLGAGWRRRRETFSRR
jgi:hypothetical protein